MFWILTILVCVASAEKCNVSSSQTGKLVKPNASIKNGATFLHKLYIEPAEQCHIGCCNSKECDTSLHTGSNLTNSGDNCFYFNCSNHCFFGNATSKNFSVYVVSREHHHGDLPDFSGVFTSSGPEEHRPTDSEKESENRTSNSTVTTAEVKPDAPANNETNEIEPTTASSGSKTGQVTVVDHAGKPADKPADKPATKDKTNSGTVPQQTPDTKANESIPDENVKQTPTKPAHKLTLPNEVPVVKVPTKATQNTDQSKEENRTEEHSKTVVEAPEEGNMSNTTLSRNSSITVVVDVEEEPRGGGGEGYTKKDVVFWIAVVGGSSLVVLGLVMIVRVYRNKRKRLYSSLTDDYLINGMYSI